MATPGKVIQVKDKKAKIKQPDHEHWVDTSMIDSGVKLGDYVLTYQEAAINKISTKQAKEILTLIAND
ncbi:HypC/HybG/HupF family hydrogenase formation chaperone [Patescibacteria group bacterium]